MLVHVNTLLQQALAEPAWVKKLAEDDRRGLTALFWSNVNPYGTFRLEMDERLDLGLPTVPPVRWRLTPPILQRNPMPAEQIGHWTSVDNPAAVAAVAPSIQLVAFVGGLCSCRVMNALSTRLGRSSVPSLS
ncbi:hypothetical protein, partial [Microtetraspora malaysiensis]